MKKFNAIEKEIIAFEAIKNRLKESVDINEIKENSGLRRVELTDEDLDSFDSFLKAIVRNLASQGFNDEEIKEIIENDLDNFKEQYEIIKKKINK